MDPNSMMLLLRSVGVHQAIFHTLSMDRVMRFFLDEHRLKKMLQWDLYGDFGGMELMPLLTKSIENFEQAKESMQRSKGTVALGVIFTFWNYGGCTILTCLCVYIGSISVNRVFLKQM